MLGSPLTGLQVNITPETSASTISWTATPIAGESPADSLAQMRVVDAVYESMRTGAPAPVAADRVPARR